MFSYIRGFTFGWDAKKGDFFKSSAKESLQLMKERTNSDTVIIALAALQDHPQSTEIDYMGEHMVSDEELEKMIDFSHSIGLRVILKPTINCKDGTWRAHINFFDMEIPCEPKWADWFLSYTDYQLHYARIAEKTGCEMFIVGCEMVQAERRVDEWTKLIKMVKAEYNGLVTYNTDKYQENQVQFWDAVDVISSSGYYPIDDWENQLNRIESIIQKYNKPFFFAEAGCPSRTGSSYVPNDWSLDGEINLKEQAQYYRQMFNACKNRHWIKGFGLWDWETNLYPIDSATNNDGYGVYGKEAEIEIKKFYDAMEKRR